MLWEELQFPKFHGISYDKERSEEYRETLRQRKKRRVPGNIKSKKQPKRNLVTKCTGKVGLKMQLETGASYERKDKFK